MAKQALLHLLISIFLFLLLKTAELSQLSAPPCPYRTLRLFSWVFPYRYKFRNTLVDEIASILVIKHIFQPVVARQHSFSAGSSSCASAHTSVSSGPRCLLRFVYLCFDTCCDAIFAASFNYPLQEHS